MPTSMRYNRLMKLKEYLALRRTHLADYLEKFISDEEKRAGNQLSDVALERLAEFSTKGKMLRGIFVMLGYEMFSPLSEKEHITSDQKYAHEDVLHVAVAMELSHAAILIHDDIMDNDRTRRGDTTMFAHYAEDAAKHNIENTDEYGKSMAMIVADAGLFLTYELLGDVSVDGEIRSRIMKKYSSEMLKICLGQFMDYHFGKTPQERSSDEIQRMYQLKTGSYTFTLPLMLGAYMAGKVDEELTHLEEISAHLGEVFQMKDDELGIFGDSTQTGKPVGADIAENKKTLFRAALFDAATNVEKRDLENIFGQSLTDENVKYVQKLLEKYDIRENMQKRVDRHSEAAHFLLSNLSLSEEYSSLFKELIDYNRFRGA